eukprot:CAMPEP_0203867814 /NCGR_PEP_ID=MMETSP0359-20131031/16742_1 /ASSEMBLY_ACC=CAM_ASM_000338 /TAXON_ID=268821 /ORGANISM="Scrippsiella Hangoei, Strain SHTV-5" /LENGTH=373 /DNA_ID=CAMNT_0050786123 /DNA_START=97 /DNA_END=1218 /DNA_ORIENTATION=-
MSGDSRDNAGQAGKRRSSWFGGCRPASMAPAMALLSCVLFCLNSELLQALQTHTPAEERRPSPGLNLLLCHLGGLVFAPNFLLSTAYDTPAVSPGADYKTGLSAMLSRRPRLCALLFALLLMGYNYCWLLSAGFLAASVTTALFQTSVGMVYAMSVPLFGEPLTFLRVLGIGLLILGSMLASGVTGDKFHNSAASTGFGAGLAFAFTAAVGVALYQVLFRHLFGQWKHDVRFLAFFGAWISVWHVLVILPLLCLSSWWGFEALVLPRGHLAVGGSLVAAVIASTVNTLSLCIALWGSVMLLPCVSALSVPLMLCLDMGLHHVFPGREELAGQVLIVLGVVLVMDLAAQLVGGRDAGLGLGKMVLFSNRNEFDV